MEEIKQEERAVASRRFVSKFQGNPFLSAKILNIKEKYSTLRNSVLLSHVELGDLNEDLQWESSFEEEEPPLGKKPKRPQS